MSLENFRLLTNFRSGDHTNQEERQKQDKLEAVREFLIYLVHLKHCMKCFVNCNRFS